MGDGNDLFRWLGVGGVALIWYGAGWEAALGMTIITIAHMAWFHR